jgi:hypothetical protein
MSEVFSWPEHLPGILVPLFFWKRKAAEKKTCRNQTHGDGFPPAQPEILGAPREQVTPSLRTVAPRIEHTPSPATPQAMISASFFPATIKSYDVRDPVQRDFLDEQNENGLRAQWPKVCSSVFSRRLMSLWLKGEALLA